MSPKKLTAFRLDPDLLNALAVIKERDGVPVTEQVTRALRAWVESKGVAGKKADRKRASTRSRS